MISQTGPSTPTRSPGMRKGKRSNPSSDGRPSAMSKNRHSSAFKIRKLRQELLNIGGSQSGRSMGQVLGAGTTKTELNSDLSTSELQSSIRKARERDGSLNK